MKTILGENRLTAFGVGLLVLAVLVSRGHYDGEQAVLQFLCAAAPFVLMGLGVACACAGMARHKTDAK